MYGSLIVSEGDYLKRYSINPLGESAYLRKISPEIRAETFKKNLDSYINHVLDDNVVSTPYYYKLGENNEIYVDPSHAEVFIDERERGGLYRQGLIKALSKSLENPGKTVFLYSPPGITSFDSDPDNPYTEVNKYIDGQLYVIFSDGARINNVAVSISQTGEPWVKQIMGNIYDEAEKKRTEIEKISHFITNPKLTENNIDQFFEKDLSMSDMIIYTNNKDRKFTLSETFDLLRRSFAGELEILSSKKTNGFLFDEKNINQNFIFNTYRNLIFEYMAGQGLKTLKLGGSCGSDQKFSFEDMINNHLDYLNNLSSLDRFLSQIKPKEMGEKNEDNETYLCSCGSKIPYEKNVDDKSTWLKACPSCGKSLVGQC